MAGGTSAPTGCSARRYDITRLCFSRRPIDPFTKTIKSVHLAVGDVVLVDATRPMTASASTGARAGCSLRCAPVVGFPISERGRKGDLRRGEYPSLPTIVLVALNGRSAARRPIPTHSWPIYDLLGARDRDPPPVLTHAAQVFTRIRALIKHRFARSGFRRRGSARRQDLATLTSRASSRSTARPAPDSSTRFRLDHAAHLLNRRTLLPERPYQHDWPTTAAFETTRISHENFAIDSVARRAPTPQRRPHRKRRRAPCGQALNGARRGSSERKCLPLAREPRRTVMPRSNR